jgi:NitT/TauT family transport system substrate-binding protein
MHRRRKWLVAISSVALAALVATACGDDDDDTTASPSTSGGAAATSATAAASTADTTGGSTAGSGATTTAGATATSAASTLVAGCEHGVTDPSDLSADRQLARCEKGAPAPKPLPEMTTVKLSSGSRLEFMSPILLADSLGELAKENLKLDFVSLPLADAAPQLAQGTLDAAVGGLEIALFNAGHQGLPIKAVMGNYFPPDAGDYSKPQTGLWCRRDAFTTPDKPADAELQTKKWGSGVGKGSATIYYTSVEIQKRFPSFDVTKVDVQRIPNADIVTALQNGAIDCGILLDPTWLQVANDPGYFLAATQTPGEPVGAIFYGKTLLQEKPEVGVAFARAIIRTINTYYAGDYHSDPAVLAEIAKQTNQPDTSKLTQTPSLVMDWEIRKDTTTRIQDLFIKLGVITDYTTPVPEDQIVDRSYYLKAVGAQP